MTSDLNKIILITVVILAVGEGYLLYATRAPGVPSGEASVSGGQVSPVLPPVPHLPTPAPLAGPVEGVSANAVVIRNAVDASTDVTLMVSSDTTIVARGEVKDPKEAEADMAAYRADIAALMKDPEKNAQAISRLIAPSAYIERPLALADVKVGDTVATVFVDGQNADVYRAMKIVIVPR